MIVLLVVFYACCIFSDGNSLSIEDVDYAVAISILAEDIGETTGVKNGDVNAQISEGEGKVKIRLYVADLVEYRGSSNQMLETIAYTYDVSSVSELFELYRDESGRELSLLHVKKISVAELPESGSSEENYNRILVELTDYVDTTDDVKLEIGGSSIGLRSYMLNFFV
jgi:hypothetical protein